MTKLLREAFKKASKLPSLEQNIIARVVMKEIVSDKKWDKLFAESEDSLSQMAEKALAEHKQGKTRRLNPSKL